MPGTAGLAKLAYRKEFLRSESLVNCRGPATAADLFDYCSRGDLTLPAANIDAQAGLLFAKAEPAPIARHKHHANPSHLQDPVPAEAKEFLADEVIEMMK